MTIHYWHRGMSVFVPIDFRRYIAHHNPRTGDTAFIVDCAEVSGETVVGIAIGHWCRMQHSSSVNICLRIRCIVYIVPDMLP